MESNKDATSVRSSLATERMPSRATRSNSFRRSSPSGSAEPGTDLANGLPGAPRDPGIGNDPDPTGILHPAGRPPPYPVGHLPQDLAVPSVQGEVAAGDRRGGVPRAADALGLSLDREALLR